MCVRSSGVSASVKFLTLTASACFAAASSTAPPSLRHSSLLLLSRFHISASLPGRFLFSQFPCALAWPTTRRRARKRSEEHTSELQSRLHLVCRLLLEKKKYSVL